MRAARALFLLLAACGEGGPISFAVRTTGGADPSAEFRFAFVVPCREHQRTTQMLNFP
jgi:hypothetical protein